MKIKLFKFYIMKKYLLILFGAIMISSCGADQANVDACCKDMCDALSGIDMDDPSGLLDAASAMIDISENENYADVTEAQMESAMKEKCPDGWKIFNELQEME